MTERKTALVTGAGRGLGQAIAIRLASDGFDIVALDLREPAETGCMIRDKGRDCLALACDVTDDTDTARALSDASNRFGHVDVLVNNAGAYPTQPIEQLTFEDWRKLMALNLDAPFRLSLLLWKQMADHGMGRIINIASAEVFMSVPNNTAYIASKMGVIGMTRGFATDLGLHGITVNAIAPGLTRTPGTEALPQTQELFEMLPKMQAISRPGDPSDIADVVAFLASHDARFVTGQTIVVDGGLARI